jgi:hypothetical protein
VIGKICNVLFSYYDIKAGKMSHKHRPVLIVGVADNGDYVVYPISTVSNKANLSDNYDVEIDPSNYPKTNLKSVSYVRTHKRSIANRGEIVRCICNLKTEYIDLYTTIIKKAQEFDTDLMAKAV